MSVCVCVCQLWRQGKGDYFQGILFLPELSTPSVSLGKVLIQVNQTRSSLVSFYSYSQKNCNDSWGSRWLVSPDVVSSASTDSDDLFIYKSLYIQKTSQTLQFFSIGKTDLMIYIVTVLSQQTSSYANAKKHSAGFTCIVQLFSKTLTHTSSKDPKRYWISQTKEKCVFKRNRKYLIINYTQLIIDFLYIKKLIIWSNPLLLLLLLFLRIPHNILWFLLCLSMRTFTVSYHSIKLWVKCVIFSLKKEKLSKWVYTKCLLKVLHAHKKIQ